MNFAEKLNFLMNITNISENDLFKATSLDISYIKKLLSQSTVPSKSKRNINIILSFIAQNIDSNYKINSICDVFSLEPSSFPNTKKEIIKVLTKIISDTNQDLDFSKKLNKDLFCTQNFSNANTIDVTCFHGIKGRRNAYIMFLSSVLECNKSKTLYLSCDDDMAWLIDNPKYAEIILDLTKRVLEKGNKIIIVHDIKLTFYDMLRTIEIWFPLYASGSIVPYYYPNKQKGLLNRTLFLAPDISAIVSTSLSGFENKTNFFIKDKNVICNFVNEFKHYLSLCQPLLNIFTNHTILDFYKKIDQTDCIFEQRILKPCNLSRLTIPDNLMKNYIAKMNISKDEANVIFTYCSLKYQVFLYSLEKAITYDIITLPDIKDVLEKKVKFPSHNPLNNEIYYYTPQEFIEHLEHIVYLLKNYKNYQVNIQNKDAFEGCSIIIKQNVGLIFIKKTQKPFIFTINEPNFTSSFWDYMFIKTNPFEDSEIKRKKSISKIKSYIKKIKSSLH